MIKLALALALLAGSTQTAARGFARATNRSSDRLIELRSTSRPDPAKATRAAARRCLADWRAAPQERWAELTWFYRVAVGAPVWAAGEGEILTGWVDGVRRVRGVGSVRALRGARDALARDLAYLQELFSQPIDLCAEVRAWRASGWGAQRPPQFERLRHARAVRAKHFDADRKRLLRGGRALARYGGAAGRKAEDIVWNGIALPDGASECDPVFVAIAPEDSFCG